MEDANVSGSVGPATTTKSEERRGFDASAARLYQRFERLWATGDPGRAAQDPYLFISWHVRATAGGQSVEFDGVDRFRLRGELADEVYVVFDTAPTRQLLATAQPSSGTD